MRKKSLLKTESFQDVANVVAEEMESENSFPVSSLLSAKRRGLLDPKT